MSTEIPPDQFAHLAADGNAPRAAGFLACPIPWCDALAPITARMPAPVFERMCLSLTTGQPFTFDASTDLLFDYSLLRRHLSAHWN